MTKHSFTPGPWTATESNPADGYHVFWICAPEALGPHNGEKDICSIPGADPANARLIAAAPDLYAALKALSKFWAYGLAKPDDAPLTGADEARAAELGVMAAAAIAKAEGKPPLPVVGGE